MISINNRKLAKNILTKQWAINKDEKLIPRNYPVAFDLLHGNQWQKRRKQFHEKITTQITNHDIKDMIDETMKSVNINQLWYPRKTMVKFMFCLFFKVLFNVDGKNDTTQEKEKKEVFQSIVPKYIKRHALTILITLISRNLGILFMKATGYGWTHRWKMTEMVKDWQIKHNHKILSNENIADMVVTFFAGTDTTGYFAHFLFFVLCDIFMHE